MCNELAEPIAMTCTKAHTAQDCISDESMATHVHLPTGEKKKKNHRLQVS